MRRHRFVLLAGLVVAVVALVACGGDDDDATGNAGDPLADTEWVLAADALDVAVPDTSVPTASFADGTMSGSNGCNNYSAGYTAVDGSLELTAVATTFMACPPDQTAVETAFNAALGEAVGYELADDTLTLTNAAGDAVLVFDPAG